jgi:putative transposase
LPAPPGEPTLTKGQYSDEQIVAILQQAERGEKTITALCHEHNLTQNTFYRWRKRFAGVAPADIARSREIEKENLRLKRLLAERDLEVDVLKELLAKK